MGNEKYVIDIPDELLADQDLTMAVRFIELYEWTVDPVKKRRRSLAEVAQELGMSEFGLIKAKARWLENGLLQQVRRAFINKQTDAVVMARNAVMAKMPQIVMHQIKIATGEIGKSAFASTQAATWLLNFIQPALEEETEDTDAEAMSVYVDNLVSAGMDDPMAILEAGTLPTEDKS